MELTQPTELRITIQVSNMEMTISRLFHLLQSKYAENEDVPQDKPELCVQAAANFRFRRKARLRATTLREFVKVNKNLRARRVFSFLRLASKRSAQQMSLMAGRKNRDNGDVRILRKRPRLEKLYRLASFHVWVTVN